MYPRAIIRQCLARNLDLIGICDHNSSENAQYVIKASEGSGLTVLPGMEVTSSEEVHILALFDNLEKLLILQEIVYNHLPGRNDEAVFGCQAVVNELDEVEGFNERLLIGATQIPLQQIVEEIRRIGGLAVSAHIDRESFGILGQLGFLPPGLPVDALEISRRTGIPKARSLYPELASFAFVQGSDAHRISDIGAGITRAFIEAPTTAELRMAFLRENGRYVVE